MKIKKIKNFGKKYFLLIIPLVAIIAVGFVVVTRIYATDSTYIFAKIKVGYWWGSTQRSNIWHVDAINKGDVVFDYTGAVKAEILGKRSYRFFNTDEYELNIDTVLKVDVTNAGEYKFNRYTISVGSPVEIQFRDAIILGTVTEISHEPFIEDLQEKTITLVKEYADPWEYEAIEIGDTYFDGEEVIFEIKDKSTSISTGVLTYDSNFTNGGAKILEPARSINVVADVKLKQVNGVWILGEEQVIVPGKLINLSTEGYVFDNYRIVSIE